MSSIVIPYKTEVLNGEELKYALRSIEKNLTGWDRIVIVSDNPPSWLKDVHFIYMDDISGRKEYSVYKKLLHCCYVDEISENFIYWNDDHWLLQKLDVSQIKNWYGGCLNDEVQKPHTARWLMAGTNTIALSSMLGCQTLLNFDIHAPIIFDKEKFKTMFQGREQEVCIKSWYCNMFAQEAEFMEDCNLSSGLTYEQIKKEIEGKLFCSSKQGITKEYLRVLQELFPEKSKFEK